MPNSVTTMGEHAFANCDALTSVTLSDKLTTIEERVFNGCSQLKNVTIPNSVTTIGNGAFSNCKALKNVTVFWDTPLTISADAFQGIELNKVKLYVPAGKKGAYQAANVWKGFDVQEIPGGNLSGGLHWQYIPSSHTLSITGSGDMPDFNGLDQPWEPFQDEIETVTIGAGVTSVGKRAFLGSTALKSVTLPAGLKTLGVSAFASCDALTRIELPAALETIGTNALNAGGLTEIKVQTGNTHFEAAESVLYNKGKTTLICYPTKKPGASFIVPASVTTIGAFAFVGCKALTGITIPSGVKTIKESVFFSCTALTSVTLPDGLQTIGEYAFFYCIYNHRTTKTNQKYPSVNL